MHTITIVNLKCGGCASTITKSLTKAGCSDIHVDVATSSVTFNGDKDVALRVLAKQGYPQAGSKEAKSLLKKAQSFISCAKGKV
jgi:copper chaperone CopZ